MVSRILTWATGTFGKIAITELIDADGHVVARDSTTSPRPTNR